MHNEDIKKEVITQLKNEFPNWNRVPHKIKKEIACKVLKEATANYDFNQDITTPVDDLLGISNQLPAKGIINLDKMAEYINEITSSRIIKGCCIAVNFKLTNDSVTTKRPVFGCFLFRKL